MTSGLERTSTTNGLERTPTMRLYVSSSVQSAVLGRWPLDTEVTADKTGKFGRRSRSRRSTSGRHYKNGDPGANAADAEKGERLDLAIDSGSAACGLPSSVASEVCMQELIRPHQEFVAANAEKRVWIEDTHTRIPETRRV